ncbi:HDL142Cp [Eremothecium sinecaudum]|uniref:Chloride channel protein n=1 Tax=Eremothecium sinecaudum TaxID=45286 RepID=A0A0X8HSB1_9SACH|nr:HDL142Cp [Eremothecium sinecaudum]AMD20602.1 HDL142Cp [Eremothecium sinecaudum]
MSFQRSPTVSTNYMIPEVRNFDQFTTIDWVEEESLKEFKSSLDDNLYQYEVGWRRYVNLIHILWMRGRSFITLTAIGITVGCLAGFIQIFTETLVNWKSGHCARNWMLNKSFCCTQISQETGKLDVIGVVQCVKDGMWINWNNSIIAFLIFTVLSVIFAMLSAFMVKFLAPMATGSGITEIKVHVSGFQYKKEFYSLSTLAVKAIALPLAISSGLSVGKEGPSVHYATCCGYLIVKYLLQSTLTYPEQSEYLIASSASGVAVAFGAPIGGVLFGLEEMSTAAQFNLSTLWKSYYVALCGVSTLQYINPFRNGKIVLFEVTYDKSWHVQELSIFIILGIFGGLYGNFISKWNIWYVEFRRKYLSKWPLYEVLVIAIITALLSYGNEFLQTDMTESMGLLFHECQAYDNSKWDHPLCQIDQNSTMFGFLKIYFALIFATVIRAVGIVVSYGCRIPAGIFVPSMAVGATFGRSLSLLVEKFITGSNVITPGTYAFLGSAAALSGITNMTLTVVVIMFELTGAFNYIIPTMLVVAITRIVFNAFGTEGGIAEKMIAVNGFPYLAFPHQNNELFLNDYFVEDIMTSRIITIKETMHLSELELLLEEVGDRYAGFPIIKTDSQEDNAGKCIGYVSLQHIKAQLGTFSDNGSTLNTIVDFTKDNISSDDDQFIQFKDLVNYTPFTVNRSLSLARLYKMFEKLGCNIVLVEESGFLIGLITKKDFLRFHRSKNRELFGPLYKFDGHLDDKLWSLITTAIDKLKFKNI